jgi:hypothetical protein
LPALGDLEMTIIICIVGAVVGLIIAVVSNWLVLPMVLQAQERQWRDPSIRLLGDARRVRALTVAIYRYVMPVTFAAVGAAAAYYLFIADAP